MLCSQCDGDVGTGLLSATGAIHMCPTFCETWYQTCREEYFVGRANNEIVPCNNDVGCEPVQFMVQDAQDFCESAFSNFHTIEVANPADEPDLCFDGVPASRTKKGEKVT